MKYLIVTINLIFIFSNLFGQTFLPTYQSPDKGTSSNYYLTEKNNLKVDTNWIHQKEETFFWDGTEYNSEGVYIYFTYDSILEYGKYDRLYIINSNTNDTINRSNYWYDEQKRVKTFIYETFDTLNAAYKKNHCVKYYYDEFGNDTLLLFEKWDELNGTWKNDLCYKRKFNDQNYLLEDVSLQWIGNYWIKVNGDKYEYIMSDICNCPDTMYKYKWNYNKSGWDNYLIKYWTYNDSLVPVEYAFKLWDPDAGKYINYERFTDLDYANWPGCDNLDHSYKQLLNYFLQQNWYGEWVNTIRFFAEYDPQGGLLSEFEKFIDNQWINFQKYELRFNDLGNPIFQLRHHWINDQWEVYLGDTSIYYFDDSRLVTRLYNPWDTTENNWMKYAKFEYNDFLWYLGAEDHERANNVESCNVKIIPNPTRDNLMVVLLDQSLSIAKIELISSSGQAVISNVIKEPNQRKVHVKIPENLNGIYFVKTTFENAAVCINKVIMK
jgi:hypothetical protein